MIEIRRRMFLCLTWCGLTVACGGTAIKRPTAAEADGQRAACAYPAGLTAAATIGKDLPTGSDIPIDHIILIMQENRSFDHYYSELDIPGLDVAPRTATNPDSTGKLVQRFHFDTKCATSPDHSWQTEHANFDDGKNDGFVKTNADAAYPMGYFDGNDLPYYYALAKTFAISDRHFSSVLGPTWPNRMFYFAGTSWGVTHNTFPAPDPVTHKPYPTVFRELDDANVSWACYSQGNPTPSIADVNEYIYHPENFLDEANFAADVAAGKLPPVTFVEGADTLMTRSPDEGPPSDVDIGQSFVGGIIATIMNSPYWKRSVIFLTYDENGGFYDHVVPPKACAPDSLPPDNGGSVGFDQYGFRVPFFVISPYAKHGYVSHVVGDQTDILRFVEARFGLPAMSKRDANASAAFDMFDFAHPDFSVPALPTVTVDQAALAACNPS